MKWNDFYREKKNYDPDAAVADAEVARRGRPADRHADAADLRRGDLAERAGRDRAVRQRPARPDDVVHRRRLRPDARSPSPPSHTQEVYAILDSVVQKVLTDENADIDAAARRRQRAGPGAARLTGPGRPVSSLDDAGRPGPCATPRKATMPRSWRASRGSAGTLVFLLPMLLVFGLFSWWPIVRSFVMSVQQTNLVTPAEFVGLDNFRAVLDDPLLGTAVQNTLWFAVLALVFGYPVPLVAAVLMSDVRRARGLYALLAYLPVVDPAGGRRAAVAGSSTTPRPTGVFNTILGWVGLGPGAVAGGRRPGRCRRSCIEATWAAAGGTVIIYLAALVSVPPELYDAAEVDGAGVWRKVWHVTLPHLRGDHADHPDPADHRHRAGVPRAVPVHRRRPRQRDADGAAARLPATPSRTPPAATTARPPRSA